MFEHGRHRGAAPEDRKLFSEKWVPVLKEATADFSFLLTRHYSKNAALKLVGDHYQLHARQRMAVLRAGCDERARQFRISKRVDVSALSDATIEIDGFNCLITLETYFSGGVIIRCRDGCIRDLSSVHRTYAYVQETSHAIGVTLQLLADHGVGHAIWYFDKPVSNSGRIKDLVLACARTQVIDIAAYTCENTDETLMKSQYTIATSDGYVLDHSQKWVNLSAAILEKHPIPNAFLVDLSDLS